MDKNTQKISKTKNKLKQAFLENCKVKSFLDTSIKEICEKTNVSRSTFYQYYENLDQLLREIEDEILDKVAVLCDTKRYTETKSDTEPHYYHETSDLLTYLEKEREKILPLIFRQVLYSKI